MGIGSIDALAPVQGLQANKNPFTRHAEPTQLRRRKQYEKKSRSIEPTPQASTRQEILRTFPIFLHRSKTHIYPLYSISPLPYKYHPKFSVIPSQSKQTNNYEEIKSSCVVVLVAIMEVMFGLDEPLLSTIQQLIEIPEEMEKTFNTPTRAYVRDRKAMANTPMDVKEMPDGRIVLTVDMPGVHANEVKVQVEDNNTLVISGERKRSAEEEEDGKYLRMERRMGKFMRKFPLPDNVNLDSITAEYKDGVLTVTVQRLPPPEPKKPRAIEVKVGGGGAGGSGGEKVEAAK